MPSKKTTRPQRATARQKLQLSRLNLSQQELMGADVDLQGFYLQMKGAAGVQAIDRILSAEVTRTIEGASSLDVQIEDYDADLLNSKLLHNRCDVRIDGLWFRLAKLARQSGLNTLTFEDREVAVMRTYNKPIKQSGATSRNQGVTRAEFVLRMIREVKEFSIPYVIPDLHKVQPITNEKQQVKQDFQDFQRSHGVSASSTIKIKGQTARPDQRKNINTILDVAVSKEAPQAVLVMCMMCTIQESSIVNLKQPKPGDFNYRGPNPNVNPVGCFQQIKEYGWPASRDVARDAAAFIDKAIAQYAAHRSAPLHQLIENIQVSGYPLAYKVWQPEAEHIVAAYWGGETDGSGMSADLAAQFAASQSGGNDNEYEFYRGNPETNGNGETIWKPESTWACIQRLAQEVNKRAFMVSGTFYFISEEQLFRSKPRAVLNENTDGVDWIDFDWDIGKSSAEMTIGAQMNRWFAPPGSVIQVKDMGPISGRWLVSSIDRSLYDKQGEITLVKPTPALPEPGGTNVQQDKSGSGKYKLPPLPETGTAHERFVVGTGLVKPIPKKYSKGAGGIHQTEGLPGYPAIDDFANPGSPVVAPETGTVVKLSGHDPAEGPPLGPGGPLGWSIYVKGAASGTTYFMTHLADRTVRLGQKVTIGDVIATVANYDLYGVPSHCHIGVHPGKITIDDMVKAARAAAA